MHSWIERISTFLGLRLICGQHGAATDARPPAEEDSTQFSAKLQKGGKKLQNKIFIQLLLNPEKRFFEELSQLLRICVL